MDFQPHHSMLPFVILGGVAWLAIIAGIILLVIWAIRVLPGSRLMRSTPMQTTPVAVESPLDTLARRFAIGEISAEEFQRARDLLRGEPPKP
jgi:uncharacterized membrane protein